MYNKLIYSVVFVFCISFLNAKTVVLFTGLPCAGKTTIAQSVHKACPNSVILDADEVRQTINKDLSYTKEDREENLRRVTQMAILMSKSSPLVLLCFVSPYDEIRKYMREEIEKEQINFYEVHVKTSLEECIRRDVKGMYKKAIEGKIPVFTGISAPYEVPTNSDLVCNTQEKSIKECTDEVFSLIKIINPHKRHALFIGRWSPFHKGHWEIMKNVYEENKDRPLLVFVRNGDNEHWSAEIRKEMIEKAFEKMNIPGTVMIIPDMDSVNWGRGVGYTPRMIDVDLKIQAISGTKIREMLKTDDDSWKDFVCPGVDEVLIKDYKERQLAK
jgi:adenylylsulfate kinase